MKKQDNKKERATLQQQKSNVIRDRKGRTFFIEPQSEKYYRLNASEEKIFYLFDARILFSIIPIMITELISQKFTYYALIVSILVNLGFEIYYRKTIADLNESNNPPQEVVDTYHSETVLKAKRSDNMLKVLLGIIITFMVTTNPNTFNSLTDKGFLRYVGIFIPGLAIAFMLAPISEYFSIQKKLKALKKKQ